MTRVTRFGTRVPDIVTLLNTPLTHTDTIHRFNQYEVQAAVTLLPLGGYLGPFDFM